VTEAEQAQQFLDVLFEEGDVIEFRVRSNDQKGATQTWLSKSKAMTFCEKALPIHKHNKKHVWVGIAPRTAVNSTVPAVCRVLWVDIDGISLDDLNDRLHVTGLPSPTMVIDSGNGYHVYWKLQSAATPDEIRTYAKGVHEVLGGDVTHDPTRVMRLPGTWNFKNLDVPKPCSFVRSTKDSYPLNVFPMAATSPVSQDTSSTPQSKTLSTSDFDLFVNNWVDGQKHTMSLGIVGYLRKNLYQTETQAMNTLRSIHEAAGYTWPDENLIKVVKDTYAKPFGIVTGLGRLHELGVVPEVKDAFTFSFKKPPTPKIPLIDFSKVIEPQEFWANGLVGPGLLSIWAAQPKSGKSFAVMQLGHALSQGYDLWGFKIPKAVRVLYFQGELSAGMVYERAASMFPRETLTDPRRFAMTDKPDETISLIQHPELLNDIAENYDVIIVDPLSAFNSNDENSFTSVRETISVFDSLKAKGKAVVVVHHVRKLQTNRDGSVVPPTANDIRGSSAWFGAADAIAMQYSTPDGNSTVKFTFRAAPDRDLLKLYRKLNGGFTDDYQEYLSENRTLKIPMSALN
jgi:hypothetical protein